MKRLLLIATCLLMLGAPAASSPRPLSIRVSPVLAFAPAALSIRTTLEPSDDVRRLRIEVDSVSFSTSSEIPLDGKNSPRVKILQLKNVPSGLYEVRASLLGQTGTIANTLQVVRVKSATGDTF